jgi:hypothetical protein
VSKSKDGKYLIHKTEIVHIKPMKLLPSDPREQRRSELKNDIVDELAAALDAAEA